MTRWIVPVELAAYGLSDDGVEQLPSLTVYVEVDVPDDEDEPS